MFFTILALWSALAPEAVIKETDIYQPLGRSEVLVRPDGQVYVLNFGESYILQFDADGNKVKQIGSKGKGPGEFVYPSTIQFQNGHLYVFDVLNAEISVFDSNGNFQHRVKTKKREIRFCKTATGYIYFDQMFMSQDKKINVTWVDDNFENPVQLIAFNDPGYHQGLMVMQSDEGTLAQYSPLSADPKVFSSQDGKTVFLLHGEEPVLYLIDDSQHAISKTIKLDQERVPFDFDWAEEKLSEAKERSKRRTGIKIQTNFPDLFPAFRDIIPIPGGGLALNRWAGRPDDKNYPVYIDESGNSIQSGFKWETLDRIAGTVGDMAWITTWNTAEEMAGVAKVPLAKANQFVDENPIEFDGQAGRSISISN